MTKHLASHFVFSHQEIGTHSRGAVRRPLQQTASNSIPPFVLQERQAAAEAAEVAREKRLSQLRALVAPEVENDPQRVMAPTVASSAADKDKDAEGAFHPVHGYTTDQVAKDQRFKVRPGGGGIAGLPGAGREGG